MVYNIFATYGLRKAYLCKPRHMYSRKTINICIYIYMHILDTTYWYLDLVSITYFVYIVHTVHIYIYICTYIYICIYIYALYIHMSAKKPFLQQQSAWLLRKPPLPCHRGGGTIWLGGGRGVGVPAHIYIFDEPTRIRIAIQSWILGCRICRVCWSWSRTSRGRREMVKRQLWRTSDRSFTVTLKVCTLRASKRSLPEHLPQIVDFPSL